MMDVCRKIISNLALLKGYGTTFFKEYNRIASIKDRASLSTLQYRLLKALVSRAYITVPYYHSVLRDVIREGFETASLERLPILTKNVIRKYWNELLSNDINSRRWYYNTSGGSTGEPLRLVQDNIYDMWGAIAYLYYYRVMLGVDEPTVKKVLLWGSERDIFRGGKYSLKEYAKNRVIMNTVFLNTFKMTVGDMERYVRIINSFKPVIIRGYLLRLLRRDGFKVYGIDVSTYIINTLIQKLQKHGIQLIYGDISRLNVNCKGMFDAVFALDVLEHIPNLEQALLNIKDLLKKDLLKKGGLLIATVPVGENPFERLAKCPKCGHIFHPFGYVHFFKNMNDLKVLLDHYYEIIEYGVVPPSTVSGRASLLIRRLLKVLRIEKTQNVSTLYLIAKTRE
ncbi:MAG: methyltransferase domain-containing protein [Candidatus Nezhaarchaeota archaeon]|nr:methyltransferase domain-containing protein [Candidatus Nezhaarchaeota archaeon]